MLINHCSGRLLSGGMGLLIGGIAESIADPRLCKQILRLGRIIFDFLAESSDIGSQVVEFRAVLWSPNRTQQLGMGYWDSTIPHQQRQ